MTKEATNRRRKAPELLPAGRQNMDIASRRKPNAEADKDVECRIKNKHGLILIYGVCLHTFHAPRINHDS